MIAHVDDKLISGVFITFSGNCKKALSFYQSCFGGLLQFESFGGVVNGYVETPVVSGSLVSDRIIIHGSDLVHNEGRKLGNYMAIFLPCKSTSDRKELLVKMEFDKGNFPVTDYEQKLIEVTDAFDVRWILGI
ncbi:VOC family protein [Pedobacter psychroterrae]|uniref:Glyoxalase n=1 Tax=Pedobacter psychroterrae TaxID=2530453 RepID=A0A4R0NRA1_9SPHI|nr:glyoxalase [Pedobacter psychroterrae]TCD01604.1 glyoxalase [Pedobacter psychroterrae]